MSNSRFPIDRVALTLIDAGVDPGSRYCGTAGCLHLGGQHGSRGNQCLVCECDRFIIRPPAADLATALRIALDLANIG